MSREDLQMKIRLPADLKDQIEQSAGENKRSLNAEVVARLQDSFKLPPELDVAKAQLALVLDSSGYPISWGEILEHVRAVREAVGLDDLSSMNTYVLTPELIGSSRRLQHVAKVMDYYEQQKKASKKK